MDNTQRRCRYCNQPVRPDQAIWGGHARVYCSEECAHAQLLLDGGEGRTTGSWPPPPGRTSRPELQAVKAPLPATEPTALSGAAPRPVTDTTSATAPREAGR